MVDTNKPAQEFKTNWEESIDSFDALDLKPDLIRGIYGYGFVKPTTIQSKSIPSILKKKDTIAQAAPCSGKTAAFAISVLELIDSESQRCQALVLASTKELAQEVQEVIMGLGEYLKVSVHICIGGTNIDEIKKLRAGVQIVVGTPGGVHNMLKRGFLKADHLKLFVLDETEELLDGQFEEQIKEIFTLIPRNVQIASFATAIPFAATISSQILSFAKEYMRDPVTILVKDEKPISDNIKQFYVAIDQEEWKFDTLFELYKIIVFQKCIIYCNNNQKVDEVKTKFNEQGFTVSSVHDDMDQNQRDLIMREFRTGTFRILITIDMFARSIGTHAYFVINFDLPLSKERYFERIRRLSLQGVAINLVTPSNDKLLQEVEKYYNTKVVEMPLDMSNIFE